MRTRAQHATPALPCHVHGNGNGVLERVVELIEDESSVKHLTLSQPGISAQLRGEEG